MTFVTPVTELSLSRFINTRYRENSPWSTLGYFEHLTSHRSLDKLPVVGRHVSAERRRALRGRFFLALLAIGALVCLAAFAGYRIWDETRGRPLFRHGRPSPSAAPAAVTLSVTVTGPKCQVFVRVPGGDILVNRNFTRGQSLRFDEQRLSVVLSDASAARVYVNGHLRPPGKPGRRVAFVALKG